MRVYWDHLPRMVYFINNIAKKKESSFGLFFTKKKGGGVILLKENWGDYHWPAAFKTSCLGFDPGI